MQRKRYSILLRILGYCVIEIPHFAKENFMNLCMRYGFNYYKIVIDEEAIKLSPAEHTLSIERSDAA